MSVATSGFDEIAEMSEDKVMLSDDSCWEAVRSTGVFCKPSCPSRWLRRENVRFFPLPEAAEQASFRACLRCKPGDVASAAEMLASGAIFLVISQALGEKFTAVPSPLSIGALIYLIIFGSLVAFSA